MEICFITKYPPIQGGVSVHCYWAASGLAERGHRVSVVTNADEVEATFRIPLSAEERAQGGHCQRRFPATGGRVDVRSTQPPDRRELYYIPMGNPTVTRLATIATDIIRQQDCKVIFSYYLEPYGVAAYLASQWTGIPFIFKHAGSDLHRLMGLAELHTGYAEILRGANRVISRGPSRKLLLDAGVAEDRIVSAAGFSLPEQTFSPTGPSHPLEEWLTESAGNTPAIREAHLPVLGVYGKLGQYKGSVDLLHAMARLHAGGFRFHLLAASHGWQESRYRKLADDLHLTGYVHLIPFIPHWRVPSFIRSCTALAFLERDFPIKAHTPMIPLEVITCGGCLIISAEVARKQAFRTQFRDLRNAVIVPDPRDHVALADRVRYALEDSARADEIGSRGRAELRYEHSYTQYIDGLEEVLTAVAGERRAEAPLGLKVRQEPMDPGAFFAAAKRFYPYTCALLGEDAEDIVTKLAAERPAGGYSSDPRSTCLSLGPLLLSALPADGSPLSEICRYEFESLKWGATDPAAAPDGASSRPAGAIWSTAPDRRVRLAGDVGIVRFACDVEAIIAAIDSGEDAPGFPGTTRVLYHAGAAPLCLNEPTEWLIGLLRDGPRTTAQIHQAVRKRYKKNSEEAADDLERQCMDTLEALFWEGVVTLD